MVRVLVFAEEVTFADALRVVRLPDAVLFAGARLLASREVLVSIELGRHLVCPDLDPNCFGLLRRLVLVKSERALSVGLAARSHCAAWGAPLLHKFKFQIFDF